MVYFLKLMDAENATGVSSVGTDFLSEARRNSSVFLGQFSFFDPLVTVEGGNRLL